MKLLQPIILIIMLNAALQAQQRFTLSGIIIDADTREGIPYVNILVEDTYEGTASDSAGGFILNLLQGRHTLKCMSMGYETARLTLDMRESKTAVVMLKPHAIEFSEEIIIYGQPLQRAEETYYLENKLNTTDDVLEKITGLSMIRRANFALEPSIRGLSAGQINVLVDDMKIFGACIDKMDPVTSYVEIDNLQKLDLAKGGFDMIYGQTIGGTLNLKTGRPEFNKPFSAGIESGYESVSDLRFLRGHSNWSKGQWAARGSFSVKSAGDYYAGHRQRWSNSGFDKTNYKIDVSKKWATQTLTMSYIGDVAEDIGYPALLMDTRRADANIAGIEHVWNNPRNNIRSVKTKTYYNTIDHRMDDYDRDVTVRSFMPNMYMPMTGTTRTMGVLSEINFTGESQTLKIIGDVYAMKAFADMTMESLDPAASPMYVVNLADVRVQNYAIALDYHRRLKTDLFWRSSARADFSQRTLHDRFGRRELEGYWNRSGLNRSYYIASLSTAFEYQLSVQHRLRWSLARSMRLPSHQENYGFYFYNVSDGFVYTGNPELKPEISYQTEVTFESTNDRYALKANVFYNRIHNYIGGRIEEAPFKTYYNLSSAYIVGSEASVYWAFTPSFGLMTSANYKYSRVDTLDEPIPYMPPLEVIASARWTKKNYWLELYGKIAAPQKRLAKISAAETVTDGFTIVNFRSGVKVRSFMELQCGVENIFDTLYHEHSSINRLPGRGRNIYVTLALKY